MTVNNTVVSRALSLELIDDETRAILAQQLKDGTAEIWSCDPSTVPPWTDEAVAQLHAVLAKIFEWEDNNETQGQDRCDHEGTIPNPSGDGDVV